MTVAALGIIAVAVLLVRLGWARSRRLAWLGWALAAVGLSALTVESGAWGLAIGTVAGLALALLLVLRAAWASPVRTRRPARETPSVTIPSRPGDFGRRLGVFALTVPVAFVAAQWLAFGAQALARRGGAGDADAITLTLFLQPLAWGVVMTVQMIQPGPARMFTAPAVAAGLGTLLWIAS